MGSKELVPMSSADLDESDIRAVLDVLKTERLALGPRTVEFEKRLAEYVGVNHGVAVNSGTSALHIIVKSLGLEPESEVLTPSFTFAASVNVLLYERLVPVFVDMEPETYTLDPEDLNRKITSRSRAVMVVDVFGHPARWDEITRIAEKNGLRIVDDSCEALGAEYKGRKIGSFGDAAAFAFYPNKQMTTGEGGMVVTNDDEIARLCRSLRNQGRGAMGAWLEHERLGYNYRMDEMSAALGVSQLSRLESFLAKREEVAGKYNERLREYDWVKVQNVMDQVRMSWFVYVVTLAGDIDRDRVIDFTADRGIPARTYFSPVHLQPYIREQFGQWAGKLPVTEAIARRTLALPFHNKLSDAEIELVVAALRDAVENQR